MAQTSPKRHSWPTLEALRAKWGTLPCPQDGCHGRMKLYGARGCFSYKCSNACCGLTHSAFPDGCPAPHLADRETQEARKSAYAAFDRLRPPILGPRGGVSIQEARRISSANWKWIAEQLGVPNLRSGFRSLDLPTCNRAIEICEARFLREGRAPWSRRTPT